MTRTALSTTAGIPNTGTRPSSGTATQSTSAETLLASLFNGQGGNVAGMSFTGLLQQQFSTETPATEAAPSASVEGQDQPPQDLAATLPFLPTNFTAALAEWQADFGRGASTPTVSDATVALSATGGIAENIAAAGGNSFPSSLPSQESLLTPPNSPSTSPTAPFTSTVTDTVLTSPSSINELAAGGMREAKTAEKETAVFSSWEATGTTAPAQAISDHQGEALVTRLIQSDAPAISGQLLQKLPTGTQTSNTAPSVPGSAPSNLFSNAVNITPGFNMLSTAVAPISSVESSNLPGGNISGSNVPADSPTTLNQPTRHSVSQDSFTTLSGGRLAHDTAAQPLASALPQREPVAAPHHAPAIEILTGNPNQGTLPSTPDTPPPVFDLGQLGLTAATGGAAPAATLRPETTAATMQMHTPFGTPEWHKEVGNNLVWMSDQGMHSAELVLTPDHLGRIEISISINNDQASANFVSANPAVREALEEALPRLREMFANSGISLGQANVSSDSPSGNPDGSNESRSSGRRGSGRIAATTEATDPVRSQSPVGLVDTFV